MIRLRKGTRRDLDRIVDFQIALAWESERLRLDSAIVKKGVRAIFTDKSKGRYYMAQMDGEVVGILLIIPEWSDWRNATVLWIHSLYVRPEARGKGVFKKLFEFLRKKVEKSQRFSGLRLYVDKNNRQAKAVYKKLGMNKDHYLMYEWMKSD